MFRSLQAAWQTISVRAAKLWQVHTQRQQQQWRQECVGGSHIRGRLSKAVPGVIAAHAATSAHGDIQLLPAVICNHGPARHTHVAVACAVAVAVDVDVAVTTVWELFNGSCLWCVLVRAAVGCPQPVQAADAAAV